MARIIDNCLTLQFTATKIIKSGPPFTIAFYPEDKKKPSFGDGLSAG